MLQRRFYYGTAGTYGQGTFGSCGSRHRANSPIPQILTSTDCLTWTNREHLPAPPAGPADSLASIAFSNGIYVSTGSGSIVRSTNGLVYVTVSNSPALSCVVTFTSGFIGVGSGGKIYQSGDGLTWTQRTSGTLSDLHGMAVGGSLLVAVGDNGAIQTSPTGTIWTSRTSGTSLPLYGVAYSGTMFVAVGYYRNGVNIARWGFVDGAGFGTTYQSAVGNLWFSRLRCGWSQRDNPDFTGWHTLDKAKLRQAGYIRERCLRERLLSGNWRRRSGNDLPRRSDLDTT